MYIKSIIIEFRLITFDGLLLKIQNNSLINNNILSHRIENSVFHNNNIINY